MLKLDCSGTASSIVGSIGSTAVNNSGLTLPLAPILGAAPVVPPVVAPSASFPALAGLGAGLQDPTAAVPTIDTIRVLTSELECLLLKDMLIQKLRRSQILIWISKMFRKNVTYFVEK